eukprot:COSAG01_NODE_6574_length_3601_cov_4.663621_6_plen_144_part_00
MVTRHVSAHRCLARTTRTSASGTARLRLFATELQTRPAACGRRVRPATRPTASYLTLVALACGCGCALRASPDRGHESTAVLAGLLAASRGSAARVCTRGWPDGECTFLTAAPPVAARLPPRSQPPLPAVCLAFGSCDMPGGG